MRLVRINLLPALALVVEEVDDAIDDNAPVLQVADLIQPIEEQQRASLGQRFF